MGDLSGAQDIIGLVTCVAGFALEVRPGLGRLKSELILTR